MFNAIVMLLGFISSAVVTAIFFNYAKKNGLLDIPNERSSHECPTPRGGGLAIVITFLLFLAILYLRNAVSLQVFLAFTVGGTLVALIGFADDHHHVNAVWRILVHFIASGIGLYLLGGFAPARIGSIVENLGVAGYLFGGIFLVWLLNLFNFMDGIDGIAASEAIFMAGGAVLIIAATSGWGTSTSMLLLLVAACSGFLVWNWPPAKIFMGDVGSGFLGIILGLFIIMTMNSGELSLCTWLILSGAFFIDATKTLLWRMIQGKRWYAAHRSHAYQILSRRLGSHKKVTVIVLLINIFWLLPCAYLSNLYAGNSLVIMGVALLPLLYGVCWIGAGNEEY